jgi:hypothetical protein
MNGIAPGSKIRVAYEVIVPMTTFNVFAHIRYLHSFFGVWTLEVVPMLDNMVCKAFDYNDVAMSIYSSVNREPGL